MGRAAASGQACAIVAFGGEQSPIDGGYYCLDVCDAIEQICRAQGVEVEQWRMDDIGMVFRAAWSGGARRTASAGVAARSVPSIGGPSRITTRRPSLRASAISESVP